jgi:hypothetical protein
MPPLAVFVPHDLPPVYPPGRIQGRGSRGSRIHPGVGACPLVVVVVAVVVFLSGWCSCLAG